MREIEYEVIGSFITDPKTHHLIDTLTVEDFSVDTLQECFSAIKSLREKRKEITYFTISIETGIKLADIVKISSTVATTALTETNIKTLKEESTRRKIVNTLKSYTQEAMQSKDIMQLKYNALKAISEIQDISDTEVVSLKDVMTETYSILEQRATNKNDKGYYTGMTRFDMATAGLHPEELTTIGARPGVGKTILGMQWGLQIARNGKKILYTSLEMSVTQLCERILSSNTNIDGHRLRIGNIRDDEWQEITRASQVYSLDKFLIDKTSRNIQNIRAKIIKYKPELVIIDYLQLLQPASREQSREREVAVITRDLKLMALEFKIPIVILSQLNRNAEGKRPTMGDLRESGAIEQDSDNIVFIHEPTKSDIEGMIGKGLLPSIDINGMDRRGEKLSQIIIEKQRNGKVGTIEAVKIPRLMKFLELERSE